MSEAKLGNATHPMRSLVNPQSVLDNLPEGVLIADQEGHIIYVNLACERMFGYAPGELAGQIAEVLVPDHLKVTHQEHRTTYFELPSTIPMATRKDLVGRRKDGAVFPVAISLSHVESTQGPLVAAFIVDITQRKEREEELARRAETQTRLLDIIQRTTEGLYILDKDWRLTYMNERVWEKVQQIFPSSTKEELLGRSFWEVFSYVAGTEYDTQFHRAVAEQTPVEFDILSPALKIWLNVRAVPMAGELVVYTQDIDARKQAEEELQERIERRGIVIELGNALLGGMDLPDFLHEAAKQTAHALSVEMVGVWRLLPERQQVLLEAGVGWGTEYVGRTMLDVGPHTFMGHVLSGDPAVFTVEDARTGSTFVPSSLAKELGIVSSVGVVLRSMGRRYGVLTVASTRPKRFSRADIEFVTMAATLVSAAIEREESSELIEELSTPVLPLDRRILVAPMVGTLGATRIRQLGAKLLQSIRTHRAKVTVLDFTGVPSVEPNVALETAQLVKSAQLLGAHVIVTGVSAPLSKVLVEIGLDMSRFTTAVDLQGGIEQARRLA